MGSKSGTPDNALSRNRLCLSDRVAKRARVSAWKPKISGDTLRSFFTVILMSDTIG